MKVKKDEIDASMAPLIEHFLELRQRLLLWLHFL